MKHIGIIGAGPAGLAAAYDLTKAGYQVTVYEGAPQVGGLAAGFKAPHWAWSLEKYYHHWFQSDKAILGLIKELGWSDQVIFPRPLTVIYWKGKFVPFDSIFTNIPLFLLKNFPIWDVVRYGLAGAYLRFSPFWKPLEQVTAAEWTRQWFGKNVYETQWRPLLISKFGEENFKIVNMAWLWARLHSRTTRLGTFKGGFQKFLDLLAEVVQKQGGEIKLNAAITKVARAGNRIRVEFATGAEEVDALISTSSPAAMNQLVPEMPSEYASKLASLKSMGAVVMVLTLKQKLTDFYWHNLPKEAGFPFLALVEHTNYIDRENYGGDHVIYCGDYLEADHEYFKLSQEELLEKFLPALKRFNPAFEREWIKETWLFKTKYAQPVPTLNHSQNIPPLRTPMSGVYFASMSQVYPWDRGTNFAIEIGREVAQLVKEDLG